jgi:hypothetical protein
VRLEPLMGSIKRSAKQKRSGHLIIVSPDQITVGLAAKAQTGVDQAPCHRTFDASGPS